MYNPLFPEMHCPQCRHKLTVVEKTEESEKLRCTRCSYAAGTAKVPAMFAGNAVS